MRRALSDLIMSFIARVFRPPRHTSDTALCDLGAPTGVTHIEAENGDGRQVAAQELRRPTLLEISDLRTPIVPRRERPWKFVNQKRPEVARFPCPPEASKTVTQDP